MEGNNLSIIQRLSNEQETLNNPSYRMWHTSGANITKNADRALLFASYNVPFMRGQVNWATGLKPEVQKDLSEEMRGWLGVNRDGNLGVVRGVNEVF